MPLPELQQADIVRLMHMHDAAQQALGFAKGRNRSNLDNDAMYRRAVISCIQKIGEASVRVSTQARVRSPQIPWKQIVDMRNRLVHVYFSVNLDLVYEVLARDLQPSLTQLERVLM